MNLVVKIMIFEGRFKKILALVILTLGVFYFLLSSVRADSDATTLVGWNFSDDNLIADTGLLVNSSSTISVGGVGEPDVNASKLASATSWLYATTTPKYWQISLSSTGYESISLSFEQISSATGPKNFVVQYSVDNGGWTDFYTVNIISSTELLTVANVDLPIGASDQSNLAIRWLLYDNSATSAQGTNRLDNIIVTGVLIPIPDKDNDGVADADDNCIDDSNPDQIDDDDDGKGNACDAYNCIFDGTETCDDGVDSDCNGYGGLDQEEDEGCGTSDEINPVITLLGDEVVNIFVGDVYSDAGATSTDDIDGVITDHIEVSNLVNTAVAGTYHVTYNVMDTAGNEADYVARTVNVQIRPSGGGGALVTSTPCVEIEYSDWGPCVNAWQYRNFKAMTPANCKVTEGQIEAGKKPCEVPAVKNIQTNPPLTGQVLGEKLYPVGSLLRGSTPKVYLITPKGKYHILNLKELWDFYRGREIFNVSDSVLAQYPDVSSSK